MALEDANPDRPSWIPAGTRATTGGPEVVVEQDDSIPPGITGVRDLPDEVKARLVLVAARDYAFMLLDTEGTITSWSPGAERILGFTESEILGETGALFFTPEDIEAGRVGEEMEAARTMGRAEDERWHRRKDGSRFFASGVMTAVRNRAGLLIGFCKVMRDVTDRRRAQDALRQSQSYYAALVDSIDGIVWEADSTTRRHTFVNKRAGTLLGHPTEKWMREYWESLVYEEDRMAVWACWEKAFETRKSYVLDFRLVDAHGRKRWFRDYVTPVEQPGGGVRLRAVMVEVSSQKAAERRLEMQLQVTSILAGSSSLAKAAREILPILGQALEWDQAAFWAPERDGGDLVSLACWRAEAERDGQSHRKIVLGADTGVAATDPVLTAHRTRQTVWVPDLARQQEAAAPARLRKARKDGLRSVFACPVTLGPEILGVLEFSSTFRREEEAVVTGITAAVGSQLGLFCARLRSEEALWNSQEQLRQSQKMEAIGRLAGGVAHDFNNLLTAINGYSDLLLARIEHDSPYHAHIEEISKAGRRAASLTYQLLAYSRKQVIAPKVLDLNATLADMAPMLQRLLGEAIRLEVKAEQDLRQVRMDPGQVEQVVMNLAVNSRDAMPNGGELLLETSNVRIRGSMSEPRLDLPPGDYVRLSVKDTGHGIEDRVKARLFEPFFTTKESGKGTGLGLSMVYGIAQQSGGSVTVDSEPGQGATFTLYIPALKPDSAQQRERDGDGRRKAAENGQGTILLVEDEEGVRKLAGEILKGKGYSVLSAGGGGQALDLEKSHKGHLDLLLTDFIMPGMNGREVYEAISARRPGIKVLYMSGYTEDAIVRHGVETSGSAFLQKPFSPNALIEKVQALIRAPQMSPA